MWGAKKCKCKNPAGSQHINIGGRNAIMINFAFDVTLANNINVNDLQSNLLIGYLLKNK